MIYGWLKTLPDDTDGIKLLEYAIFQVNKVDITFCKRISDANSPFKIPVVLRFMQGKWKEETDKIAKDLANVERTFKDRSNDLQEIEGNIAGAKKTLDGIQSEISDLTDSRDNLRVTISRLNSEIDNFPEEQKRHIATLEQAAKDK